MALHSLRLALPPPSTFTAMPNSAANNLSPHTSNIYINIYIKRRSAKSSAQNHSTLNHDQTLILSFHEIHHSKHLGDTTPFTTIRIKKKRIQNQIYFTKNDLLILMVFIKLKKNPHLEVFETWVRRCTLSVNAVFAWRMTRPDLWQTLLRSKIFYNYDKTTALKICQTIIVFYGSMHLLFCIFNLYRYRTVVSMTIM